MKQSHLLGASAALTTLGLLGFTPRPVEAAGPREATEFALDVVHSAVHFEVEHQGVSRSWGRFNDFDGGYSFDAADPSKSSVQFTIQAESVDTNNDKRDQHLRSADFFNAKQFPEITFRSTAVKGGADGQLTVTGDLTLLGVTKSVEVQVHKIGEGQSRTGEKLSGFSAEFVIDRTEFGMNYGEGALGTEVTVHVDVEGIAQ